MGQNPLLRSDSVELHFERAHRNSTKRRLRVDEAKTSSAPRLCSRHLWSRGSGRQGTRTTRLTKACEGNQHLLLSGILYQLERNHCLTGRMSPLSDPDELAGANSNAPVPSCWMRRSWQSPRNAGASPLQRAGPAWQSSISSTSTLPSSHIFRANSCRVPKM